jgi:hypothetical protein
MFYIQIAIAIAIYAAGYATAWKVEVREVARLEASIDSANQQSQATLSAIQERVKSAQDKAEVVAVQLESEHTQSTQSIANLSTRLAAARLQYAKHSAGRGCPLPKISDTPYDQIHDEAGSYLSATELSAGFDQLVLTKNPDQLAEDKHFILAWLNTIPPEQVQ